MLLSPRQLQPSGQTLTSDLRDLRAIKGQSRTAVLLNANAKRVTGRVRDAFAKAVPAEDLFFSTSLEQAETFADTIIDRRYDTVMAGGGDGTIVNTMNMLLAAADRAACGMYRPPLPDIGVLRLGTGNGLGYATGAGRPMEDVLRVLNGERPRARPMPLMEDVTAGDVFPFGSLGYDAQLLNDFVELNREVESPTAKKLAKTLAGYFYALGTRTIPQQVKQATPELCVTAIGRCSRIDRETGEEVPLAPNATLFEGIARSVAMGTTPFYGYKMKVFAHAERRSDRFHLRVSNASIPYLLSHLPQLWNGTMNGPQFHDFLVEGVRIESTVKLPYQTSGDARGYRDDLSIKLSPRTFRVLDSVDRRAA